MSTPERTTNLPQYRDYPFPHLECRDCLRARDDYMVHAAVWRSAIPEEDRRGHLCFECLERRLDRPLREEDFPLLPINRPILLGIAIARRT